MERERNKLKEERNGKRKKGKVEGRKEEKQINDGEENRRK